MKKIELNPSLRVSAKQSMKTGLPRRIAGLLAMTIMALPSFAMAAEPTTYSPEHCEFAITFPEAPSVTQHCKDEDKGQCYDLAGYTQVYQLSSTVSFRVICNPSGEDLFTQYSGKIMEATLKSMTERSIVKTFDTSYREEDHYKQAGLVGEGKVGVTPTIYIAQLWIGHNSILSVEAELIGESDAAADEMFGSVLKSVHFLNEDEKKAKSAAKEAKQDDKDTKEDSEEQEKPESD